MIVVFTTFLPVLMALGLGAWLALKRPSSASQIAMRLAQGFLILFAFGYLVSAMNDSYYARTYWPSTPLQHALGPDWPKELVWRSANDLLRTGSLFVITFAACLMWRRSKA